MPRTIIFTAFVLGALLTGGIAFAQTDASTDSGPTGSTTSVTVRLPVVYPIAELGGCASKDECRVYCDDPANRDACFSYAQTHGLMRKDEVEKARAYLQNHPVIRRTVQAAASTSIDAILASQGGPGGCTSREECKTFCADPSNAPVCLQFAQDHGLMTDAEIALAKKLQTQVGPGGCQGEECKNYCEDKAHEQVCIAFAQQNGFISKNDAETRVRRMNISSSTRPLPPIPVDKEGRIASTTSPDLHSAIRPASSTIPELFRLSTTTKPTRFENDEKPPLRAHPNASTSTAQQSGSVLLAILHLFGL